MALRQRIPPDVTFGGQRGERAMCAPRGCLETCWMWNKRNRSYSIAAWNLWKREGRGIISCLCLAPVTKYPALEMLLSWFRLHFMYQIYGYFIQWAHKSTGQTEITAYIYFSWNNMKSCWRLGKIIQMNQLDATMIYWSIRSAQHISGNILPIIRSVRLRYLQHVVSCCCGG